MCLNGGPHNEWETPRVCIIDFQVLNCDYISVYCLAINAKIVMSTCDYKVLEENISELLLGVKLVLLMMLLEENSTLLAQDLYTCILKSEIGISWVDY
jgi:hypothetical protein